MLERIKEIIAKSGLSNGEFSDKIGIQKSSLSHVLSGRNKPSLDFVLKILDCFPEINSDWLLFGKGERGQISAPIVTDSPTTSPEIKQHIKPPFHDSGMEHSIDKIVIFYSDGSFQSYNSK
ncbi:MAG: helix-turn-helix transcriptional regulator [Bacteroidales bacterium]|nr:helix-turn-helix transcriptional regulator [Bacteroidales bacterium]